MEGKQTKRKKETENTKEDRLSELPDCLLHHIFSFADATDAVRSCTLSKRWRYLWTSLPYLNFSFSNFRRVLTSKRASFINFINQLLLRRSRSSIPIHSFHFTSSFDVKAAISHWMRYAAEHQIQHLTIEPVSPTICPIFNGYASFTTLKLTCPQCECATFPQALDLPFLKNLHLVRFGNFDGRIFSRFPNLETLTLEDTQLRAYEIQVSWLSSFRLLYRESFFSRPY
ncbi:F-box/LRR-repeat protein 25-like isoform X3 [Mercurialis annua]|uniref:F-box/LRR-repeat protein 25-like isoform X3 n=1 Tax=Mercurialis annua TaxID=3986 RepID=UPI00215E9393|nr:F-box/LRR-repeat protein 25-like isoform X3 [Mercurialis annua]